MLADHAKGIVTLGLDAMVGVGRERNYVIDGVSRTFMPYKRHGLHDGEGVQCECGLRGAGAVYCEGRISLQTTDFAAITDH